MFSEEQIALLRRLSTKPPVTLEGRFDRVLDAGINPLPVQLPISIWMRGSAEPVLRRIARTAGGWFPPFQPGPEAQEILERVHTCAREAGRDPRDVGIEGRVHAGYAAPDQHIGAIRRFMEAVQAA